MNVVLKSFSAKVTAILKSFAKLCILLKCIYRNGYNKINNVSHLSSIDSYSN